MQRKRRIQLSLGTSTEDRHVELGAQHLRAAGVPFAVAVERISTTPAARRPNEERPLTQSFELDVDLSELSLDAALVTSRLVADKHRRLGKETMQILAPMMVRPLARSTPPPPRFAFTARAAMAMAAVAVVLTSASVALALS